MYLGYAAKTKVGRLFDLDEHPYEYRNVFLYHFMARQGLDQPMSDSAAAFPKLNYQAIVQGKTSLQLDFLRNYVGERNFKRSMNKLLQDKKGQAVQPEDLIRSFGYYHNQDLDWFLGPLYTTSKKYNYSLKRTENCTYVYTATVRNKGQIQAPYSITGMKDGKPVLTEWYEGHERKKNGSDPFGRLRRSGVEQWQPLPRILPEEQQHQDPRPVQKSQAPSPTILHKL